MTERRSESGDDSNLANDESESPPELLKVEPRPCLDTPEQNSEDDADEGDEVAEDDDEDDSDEEEEPRLKYARLTQHLSTVYRNGDMTSAFLVAGDKMIIGTHNGNIHVIQLPTFQTLRVYHAHSTSVTSISISPFPPPLPAVLKAEPPSRAVPLSQAPLRQSSIKAEKQSVRGGKAREQFQIPNTPSNNIYIATASMDGNVCVQSLLEPKDVSLRDYGRPVQSVALSPDYRNDKTYICGGMGGNLVLTVNPPLRKSTSTTVGTAAATAAGWLGTMGLAANAGKDTVLHSGEGTINTIKWSLSGKYVVWLNEHGIKILRTKHQLENTETEDAWKRLGHIDRPQTDEWEEMAGVWKGRAEWIDEQAIGTDEDGRESDQDSSAVSQVAARLRQPGAKTGKAPERLLVGWGGTVWIIHVHPGGMGIGEHAGVRRLGRAEIVKKLRMDCIICGISLYTQNLLLVLAYCKPDNEEKGVEEEEEDKDKAEQEEDGGKSSGGSRRRQNGQAPELRLIDLGSQAEVDKDSLTVSRFERLTSNDYHLGVLAASNAATVNASRGVLETMAGLGSGMWNAAINPKTLFSSSASVRSKDSNDGTPGTRATSVAGSARMGPTTAAQTTVHPNLAKAGAKIFIHSPYDCILATKRDLGDHLGWLLDHQKYEEGWNLLDEHPEIAVSCSDKASELGMSTPQPSKDDFFDDSASVMFAHLQASNSSAEKEKRRIGDAWLQDLVDAAEWTRAGEVAAKVLNTPDRWEKWLYTFAGANKFDEIVNYMPSEALRPPIPATIYEIILGHYIQEDKARFKDILERWSTDLFDIHTVTTALENQLKFRDVREDSIEDGERGRDWRIVKESLAQLYEADGRFRDALKCYIRLQDADSAMRLIRDNYLADAVTDDVPSFIALRVPEAELDHMTIAELDEATSEAIGLLADEAQRGLIKPEVVVQQLAKKELNLYIYFYFRTLWVAYRERPMGESLSLVDEFADLAVHLFALFDRDLLMDFLRVSTSYAFEKAAQECEAQNYIPELVYLYSKTGQMKRALYLIIDRLSDVSRAIQFAKDQNDPDLWNDLLDYSMDKPRFIRGLLEEVGTAIDPITLVRRIPEGLEIPGLREGLKHIMKEHEIQYSISSGVARVLRSEVAAAQSMLRAGQRKGVKFDVTVKAARHLDLEVKEVATITPPTAAALLKGSHDGGGKTVTTDIIPPARRKAGQGNNGSQHQGKAVETGHCASCHEAFSEWDLEALVGFACGHVFHLPHLLEWLDPDQKPDPTLLSYGQGVEDRSRNGRFVGSKVTHARLLRDRIGDGCPVCVGKCL